MAVVTPAAIRATMQARLTREELLDGPFAWSTALAKQSSSSGGFPLHRRQQVGAVAAVASPVRLAASFLRSSSRSSSKSGARWQRPSRLCFPATQRHGQWQ
nr:hypothetical protein Itr_chr02CG11650 [Ipomoea trifida]